MIFGAIMCSATFHEIRLISSAEIEESASFDCMRTNYVNSAMLMNPFTLFYLTECILCNRFACSLTQPHSMIFRLNYMIRIWLEKVKWLSAWCVKKTQKKTYREEDCNGVGDKKRQKDKRNDTIDGMQSGKWWESYYNEKFNKRLAFMRTITLSIFLFLPFSCPIQLHSIIKSQHKYYDTVSFSVIVNLFGWVQLVSMFVVCVYWSSETRIKRIVIVIGHFMSPSSKKTGQRETAISEFAH